MRSASRNVALLDFMLGALGSACAVWSSFMSISRDQVALAFAVLAFVGGLFSYGCSRWLKEETLARWSGPLYAVIALSCVFFMRDMNGLLPDGGFPLPIIFAGVFSWVVALTSFVAWRDSTLCFQAVPCIAVFGLVGAFDTYKAAPFVFFIFLVCIATLFFRTHARSMVRLAELSVASSANEKVSGSVLVERAFESGAWRWMAGPEWAVSSALIIISLSVLGAPVLRSGVSSVAGDGIVRLVPNLPSTTPAPSSGTNFSGSAELNVGNGPAGLLGIEVLRVKTKNPKYLLSEVYDSYRAGWAKSIRTRRSVVEEVTVGGWSRTNYLPRMKGRLTAFEIRYVAGQHDRLYFPGEILTLNSEIRGLGFDRVGTIVASNLIPVGTQFSGTTRVINVAVPPNASGRVLPPTQGTYTDVEFVPPSVSKLAASVTASATTDVERAQLIYEELGRRCRYNLQAPAVPRGKDPVEHFLFTEKQGYCDLFASAMATMARSTGLVSRVCVGFLVRSRVPDRAGFYPVNDDDYHMWAEVYFDGVGWVPFDPTEIAENVSPNETNKSVDWSRIGQIIGVVVAALAGVGILAKIAYDSRGGMRMVTRNSETQKQYLVVQQAIERATGKPRRLNETSSEYLGRVGEQIPDLVPPAKLLLDRLEAELFSRDAADERLAADVKEFRKKSRQRP